MAYGIGVKYTKILFPVIIIFAFGFVIAVLPSLFGSLLGFYVDEGSISIISWLLRLLLGVLGIYVFIKVMQ